MCLLSDTRLDSFRAALEAVPYRLLPLGGYAVPLAPALGIERAEQMAAATGPVPRPGILDIAPYVGGEAKIAGVERPIRLASNESALGPSTKAIAAYRSLADEIHRYPEGNALELREALGRNARARSRRASSAAPARTN